MVGGCCLLFLVSVAGWLMFAEGCLSFVVCVLLCAVCCYFVIVGGLSLFVVCCWSFVVC